jgi:hypothetical protein
VEEGARMNETIMNAMGYSQKVERGKRGLCALCAEPVRMEEFRDALSMKEYGISKMCQSCQDDVFGTDKEV